MPANWMDHAIASVAPRMAARRVLARQAFETLTRGYDGASKGRRTDGWRAPGSSADTEIGVAGALLRDRMRDLVRNNPHAAKAVAVLVNNIVGSGIMPRAASGDACLFAGQNRAGPKADPPRTASGAILHDVAFPPAWQHPKPETRDVAVPDEVFGGLGFCGVDDAFGEFGHGKSASGLSGLHSAQCGGLVNEHIDIAWKKENPRNLTQGLNRSRERKGWPAANQNAGSGLSTALLSSAKRTGIPMASKSTLNAKNLEALGVERLAQLLIEISTGDAAAKRKLRLELAGAEGPREAAREITKRLTSIAKARTFVNWQNRKPLVKDLQTQRSAIMEQIAPHDPDEALALLWRFMGLATPVFERCDDSSGTVIDIFHQACADLGAVAKAADAAPEALARQVQGALQDNGFGQYDGLIAIIAPALGPDGVAHLKALVEELGRTPVSVPPKSEWQAVGWGSGGTRYAHEMEERARQSTVEMALKDIADVQGDVDGFIAQYDPKTRKVPKIAAEIAQRLLSAGRAGDALGFIERAEVKEAGWIPPEWQDARLAVLEALDRKDEAQAFRWACFERDLSGEHLRAYLKRLPDFEDIEAEGRAMAHAAAHPDLLAALAFFLNWPSLAHAARLLIERQDEVDGDHYEFLVPAAETLAEKYPLAATVALRAMIDFTLNEGRQKRYGYAAQHLATCADLAGRIEDFGSVEPHPAYAVRLKAEHSKKSGFWSRMDG